MYMEDPIQKLYNANFKIAIYGDNDNDLIRPIYNKLNYLFDHC